MKEQNCLRVYLSGYTKSYQNIRDKFCHFLARKRNSNTNKKEFAFFTKRGKTIEQQKIKLLLSFPHSSKYRLFSFSLCIYSDVILIDFPHTLKNPNQFIQLGFVKKKQQNKVFNTHSYHTHTNYKKQKKYLAYAYVK